MYTNIIIPRRWSRITTLCRSFASIEGQKLPQTSVSGDGISPPVRIPRGPTDILQALAATVGPDPTATQYKYHDDPYLIPLSNFRKRSYALSAEAGRKAAAWIRDEHAELFNTRVWDPPMKMKTPHINADPFIDAYSPRPIYNDESKVTEEDLRYTVRNTLIEDSIKVFQLLGGAEGVSEDLKMEFLQLLCFYNEKEPDSLEWLEEKWYSSNTRDRQAATWKVGGLADQIFTSMEPKTPEAYCTVIQGMAKYYQAERADMLVQEATEKGIPLSTDVYNTMLGCVGFLREGIALRIEALKAILNKMNEQGLSPNQETLSACLKSLSFWGGGQQLRQIALQIVAEFKQLLGIEPNLSAYYYLLCLFCKERGPRTDILTSILNDLEKRESIEAEEATDTNFFITAMGVCSDHLQDLNLAERVHALLMKGGNYKLVGDAYKESIYYRHYVTIHCRHAPFEKTTEILDTIIPNIYVPEPSVMEHIINALELAGSGDRLAQTWSQLIVFGHAKRIKLVEKLLSSMINTYPLQDEEVKEKIRTAAASVLNFSITSEQQEQAKDSRTPNLQKLSANALANIIEVCSDAAPKSPCWAAVSSALGRLQAGEAAGVPGDPARVALAAGRAVRAGEPALAAMAVSYLAENGFEEATTASEETLSTLLNRPQEEIQLLLQKSKSELENALHPSALAIVEAYHLAKSGGGPIRGTDSRNSSSSSDSDSDSDNSDEE